MHDMYVLSFCSLWCCYSRQMHGSTFAHNTGRAKQHMQAMVAHDAVQCFRQDVACEPRSPQPPQSILLHRVLHDHDAVYPKKAAMRGNISFCSYQYRIYPRCFGSLAPSIHTTLQTPLGPCHHRHTRDLSVRAGRHVAQPDAVPGPGPSQAPV